MARHCAYVPDGRGGLAIICGHFNVCAICHRLSGWQCDVFVDGARTRRCDLHLCDQHRTNLGPDKDACPEHAPRALAALARRRDS